MKEYPISMVPGPVMVYPSILECYKTKFGSGDLETDFFDLYHQAETQLQKLAYTNNLFAIQTGEGMLALWAALKSCLLPGDRVLSIATGLFGYGIASMAESLGANVKTVGINLNETIQDFEDIEKAILEHKPKMITVVHCETPSGTLNPLGPLCKLKKDLKVPLIYVDAVSSIGGTPIYTDEWGIDLLLGGSQKCLSAPPSVAFVGMSSTAIDIIHEVNYTGYDALKPFINAQQERYFPYTPHWHGVAALSEALKIIIDEGIDACFDRHEKIARFCREALSRLGVGLYPSQNAIPSPTVTAAYVPKGINWSDFDIKLRNRGIVLGGNYGGLEGKVFRIGHMGSQANLDLVQKTIIIIEEVIKSL